MDTDLERWLSTGQVSRLVGISSQRIGQLVKEGRLAGVTTPLGYLVEREVAEEFARRRAEDPTYLPGRTSTSGRRPLPDLRTPAAKEQVA